MAGKRQSTPGKSVEDREFARAERVLRKHWRKLLKRKGVTHLDVNYRERHGKRTNEIVIRIHVEKKLPLDQLRSNQIFTFIEGIPVDLVETRNTYERHSGATLQGGDKIAPKHNPSAGGTLGIVCFTRPTRLTRLLTNAHVIFGGKRKSDLPSRVSIVQPSNDNPIIGFGLRDECYRNALVDCGLIEPIDGNTYLPGVKAVQPQPSRFGTLTREDVSKRVRVQKMGASTGVREGIVDSIRLTFSTTGHGFLFQIGIKPIDGGPPFSMHGDSGSLVLRGDEIVGLLHGATSSGQIAVACHINDVLSKLKVEL